MANGTDSQRTDRQTDRQTDKQDRHTFLAMYRQRMTYFSNNINGADDATLRALKVRQLEEDRDRWVAQVNTGFERSRQSC